MNRGASDMEDEPEAFQSSGDEWEESKEDIKTSRRISQRLSKKPRVPIKLEDSSSESEAEETRKPRSKNGVNKKRKLSPSAKPKAEPKKAANAKKSTPAPITPNPTPKVIYSNDYSTGSFVIAKKDAQVGDPNKHPCVWRIDGKALLQKYEPFSEGDNVRHKSTSVYTGWSNMDKDLYAPVNAEIMEQSTNQLVIQVNWDKIKELNMESD